MLILYSDNFLRYRIDSISQIRPPLLSFMEAKYMNSRFGLRSLCGAINHRITEQ